MTNTLRRMVAWVTDAAGVRRGKVAWRGTNPRPPQGAREMARRRRQMLAGQHGTELMAEARAYEEEQPLRVINVGGGLRRLSDWVGRRAA